MHLLEPLLPKYQPHLVVVYPIVTGEAFTTKLQWYNNYIRCRGNAVPTAYS